MIGRGCKRTYLLVLCLAVVCIDAHTEIDRDLIARILTTKHRATGGFRQATRTGQSLNRELSVAACQ